MKLNKDGSLSITIPADYVKQLGDLFDKLSIPRAAMPALLVKHVVDSECDVREGYWEETYVYPSRAVALAAFEKLTASDIRGAFSCCYADESGEPTWDDFTRADLLAGVEVAHA